VRTAVSKNTPSQYPSLSSETPPPFADFEDEELDPAVEELKPFCAKERKRTLAWHYQLGQLALKHLLTVQHDRDKCNQKMYGEHFLETIAKQAGNVSGATLKDCFMLVTTYNGKAFADLCQHDVITISHAVQLAQISDDKELLAELQAKVIAERWTVKQLYDAILEACGRKRKPGGGRRLKVPKDVKAALVHLTAQIAQHVKMHEQIWFGREFDIIEELSGTPADKLAGPLKEKLDEALTLTEKLAELAVRDAEQLREAIAGVEERIRCQAEAEAEAEEEAVGVA
jgi:hypothetical protein